MKKNGCRYCQFGGSIWINGYRGTKLHVSNYCPSRNFN